MRKLILLLIAGLITGLTSSAQTPEEQKERLPGKWNFEKFDSTATTSGTNKALLAQRSQLAKALVFTFGKDGSFQCEWPGGPPSKNYSSKYRFYPQYKNLIIDEKDNSVTKLTVVSITTTTLTLKDNEEDVLMVFKRKE